MFESAKARSDWPLTRLTITAASVKPVLLYTYSVPGVKLSAVCRTTILSTSSSVITSSSRHPARASSDHWSRRPLVWVSR